MSKAYLLLSDGELSASKFVIDSLKNDLCCLIQLFLHRVLFSFIFHYLPYIELLIFPLETSLRISSDCYIFRLSNVSILFDCCLYDGLSDFMLHFLLHLIENISSVRILWFLLH